MLELDYILSNLTTDDARIKYIQTIDQKNKLEVPNCYKFFFNFNV